MDNSTVTTTEFSIHDYSLFAAMLAVSAGIGIYFGCFGKKQSSADEYLLGGKEMGVFPIAMSLVASNISGITILAVPADVYRFGVSYWFCNVGIILGLITSVFIFIPVFYKIQVASTYEYLRLRFDNRVRKLSSFLFALSMVFYLPIVIYGPALALSQGTGLNVHTITPIICGVCIFYTTIGGLKAVVWTDTLQFILMIIATAIITYLGTVSLGGVSNIWEINKAGGRLDIDFDPSITNKDSFWSSIIGVSVHWIQVSALSQGVIQKCLALPSIKHVKRAFIIYGFGLVIFITSSIYNGLMVYAKYHDCDPFSAKEVKAHDQLLPYFVIQVARNIPGLSGLFIAGVFSAALSTLSAAMNCLACTIYEDFLSDLLPKNITEKRISNILKLLVVIVGVVCTALVFVVEHMGSILPLGFSLGGVCVGPLMGLFLLGMLVPKANANGAFYGTLVSVTVMAWIVFGSQYYKINGIITYKTKTLVVSGCKNETFLDLSNENINEYEDDWEPFFVYRISIYYYTLIGTTLIWIIGIPISFLTSKSNSKPVNRDLLSPAVHWTISDEPPTYASIDKALHLVEKI